MSTFVGLTEDERALRGLLQFFVCADARRSASEQVPLRLRYKDLIVAGFELPEVQASVSGGASQASSVAARAKENVVLEIEDNDDEDIAEPVPDVGEAVADAVEAAEAAEAAEAEVEALRREKALQKALEPESEARRKRIEARKNREGQSKWNFGGKNLGSSDVPNDDRFREHEADLDSRRRLAGSAKGRFGGDSEHRQSRNSSSQKRLQATLASIRAERNSSNSTVDKLRSVPTSAETIAANEAQLQELRSQRKRVAEEVQRIERNTRSRQRALSEAAGFPEEESRLNNLPSLAALDVKRELLKAKKAALEELRTRLTQEMEAAREERHRAEAELEERRREEEAALQALQKALQTRKS
eukprot:TRINITY_DN44093_c0_g1_i1.p1 TRINITY_DN44093_c0_g1~~TRINITY_DN44093_c0_g1_i1.p1  ORF type:complete len:359 (-),score=118.03 TRINITY_DN44093_c0_g1_i1:137-1213(-)